MLLQHNKTNAAKIIYNSAVAVDVNYMVPLCTSNFVITRNQPPMPTQPSIPPGSANEDQLRLERKRQIWLIPLVDERGVCR